MVGKIKVRIIGLEPDFDQVSGDPYTKVIFAAETRFPPPPAHLVQAGIPMPHGMAWKHILYLMIPNSKWHDQYQMWKEYELEVNESSGELNLTRTSDGV